MILKKVSVIFLINYKCVFFNNGSLFILTFAVVEGSRERVTRLFADIR